MENENMETTENTSSFKKIYKSITYKTILGLLVFMLLMIWVAYAYKIDSKQNTISSNKIDMSIKDMSIPNIKDLKLIDLKTVDLKTVDLKAPIDMSISVDLSNNKKEVKEIKKEVVPLKKKVKKIDIVDMSDKKPVDLSSTDNLDKE